MAHVAKYCKSAMGHMLSHYDRSKDNLSGDINPDRTKLNYNLAEQLQPLKQLDFIHKRLSEVKVQNRKDLNVMVSWVLTAPKDLPAEEHKAFFQAGFDFLKKRYGVENIISAWVHMDETTPHMHFAFVPVKHGFKPDKKDPNVSVEYWKVSAKEVVNRYDLKVFHQDLSKFVGQQLGHEVSILNGATKEGNRSIIELKRKSATERLQEVTEKASKIVFKAQESIKTLKVQEKVLKAQIEGLKRDLMTFQQVKDVPHSRALIGDKQLVATEDFEALCKTAAAAEELLKEIRPARKIYAQMQEILQDAQTEADKIIKQAQDKADLITRQEHLSSVKYREKLKHIEDVINSDPQLVRDYQRAEKDLLKQTKIQQDFKER